MSKVEGTNDYSIVSKLSAANAGFFHDEFLAEFVEKPRKRAPLINWGYFLRWKSLERSFGQAVSLLNETGEPFQVLSLGAGFDTTYFQLSLKHGPNQLMTYFEVDLGSNVERKAALIRRSSKCLQYLAGSGLSSRRYQLLSCDLRDTERLGLELTARGFHWDRPTLVLSGIAPAANL